VVLTANSHYYREEGMSFGVGDESGRTYWATCRPATPEEAASKIAAREAAIARASARQDLEQIEREIEAQGNRPDGPVAPEGERIEIAGRGQDIYGGGSWLVVGDEHIWYVRNNGADGDNWANNNILTCGAGAIGWRVPATAELAARIKRAVAAGWGA
jgi:hypothetical protein